MHLRKLIVGRSRARATRGPRKLIAREPRLLQRVRPSPAQQLEFCTPDQTLAAVRDETRMILTPVAQRVGSLLHAADVEEVEACRDHAAVDRAGDDGGQLSCGDRNHHFVHQRDALIYRA